MSCECENANILVTGFGPFEGHTINASWEAVKLLPDKLENYNLIKEQIKVCYQTIDEQLPILWDTLKPVLVIHVGVSREAHRITLEQVANRVGYNRPDCMGQLHSTGKVCCASLAKDSLKTEIDIKNVVQELNDSKLETKFCISSNAGRYLCEYIFYTSLMKDSEKTLFIHVPRLDTPYSAKQISEGILEVIKCILKNNSDEIL